MAFPRNSTAYSSPRPVWEGETLGDLESLRGLKPNWNGYGADIISSAVIASARSFVQAHDLTHLPRPQVVPMTRGRLQFEWTVGSRALELEFESATQLHYLKYDTASDTEDEAVIALADASKIQELLAWLIQE